MKLEGRNLFTPSILLIDVVLLTVSDGYNFLVFWLSKSEIMLELFIE